MTLNLCTPCFSFSPLLHHPNPPSSSTLFFATSSLPNLSKSLNINNIPKASLSESQNDVSNDTVSDSESLLDQQLVLRVAAAAKDADEALHIIAENSTTKRGGVVSTSDCCSIISAALKRNNHELALSVFYAMRASFDQGFFLTARFITRYSMLSNSGFFIIIIFLMPELKHK